MSATLRRLALVGATATVVLLGMVVFFAWLALRVDWDIPDVIALTGPSEVYAADGTLLARFTSEVDRRLVDLEDVAPAAVDAIITAEDARFYEHDGVDPLSLVRAVVANLRTGGIAQGGSTLTQQYVKNAYVGVGSERTLVRKVREAVISIQLERDATKEEILEDYLNAIYFGEGAYGIEAAALTYYGHPAALLTPAEGATLAQLIPAPTSRNPRKDPSGARDRRNGILDRMLAAGLLTTSAHAEAVATPVEVLPRVSQQFADPYVVDYVRAQVVRAVGEDALLTGRLKIVTTIDPAAQEALRAAVAANLPAETSIREETDANGNPVIRSYDAGAVAMEPTTGRVIAMYGGRDHATEQVNLATQGIRQPGSTFKPITFMAALEQGRKPTERVRAPASATPRNCEDADGNPIVFEKPVSNAGGSGYGTLTLASGLANSVNTVFIQLGCDVGPQNVVDMAARLGVRNPVTPNGNVSIGGQRVGPSVLDLTNAFATIANEGVFCPAHVIEQVLGPDGREIVLEGEYTVTATTFLDPGFEQQPRPPSEELLAARPPALGERDGSGCYDMVDADIARTTAEVLTRVVSETTGRRANIGRPQAGKTGTTNDETDAWFAGFTPDLAMAVWVGDTAATTPMRNLSGFRRVQGGTIPALVWKGAAEVMLADVPPRGFTAPGELDFGPDAGRQPAPARPRPTPTRSSTPTPSPTVTTDEPTDEPTDDASSPTSSPSPTQTATTPSSPPPTPTEPDCFLVFCDPNQDSAAEASPSPSPRPATSASPSPSPSPSDPASARPTDEGTDGA